MPSLEKLHGYFSGSPFVLLAVSVGEEASWVKRFARKEGLSFPVLVDSKSETAYLYGIRSHPAAYLIDPEGYIAGTAIGYRKWDRDEMKELVRSLSPKIGSKE